MEFSLKQACCLWHCGQAKDVPDPQVLLLWTNSPTYRHSCSPVNKHREAAAPSAQKRSRGASGSAALALCLPQGPPAPASMTGHRWPFPSFSHRHLKTRRITSVHGSTAHSPASACHRPEAASALPSSARHTHSCARVCLGPSGCCTKLHRRTEQQQPASHGPGGWTCEARRLHGQGHRCWVRASLTSSGSEAVHSGATKLSALLAGWTHLSSGLGAAFCPGFLRPHPPQGCGPLPGRAHVFCMALLHPG